jgi:hypothetical protein
MKHILLTVRTRRDAQPRRPTSKNDIQTGNVSVLILLPNVVFSKGMAHPQSSFWPCIGQCLAPAIFERSVTHRKEALPFNRPARNSAAPLCLFWSGFWINSSIRVWRGANDSFSNSCTNSWRLGICQNLWRQSKHTYRFDRGDVVRRNHFGVRFRAEVCRQILPEGGIARGFSYGRDRCLTFRIPWCQ